MKRILQLKADLFGQKQQTYGETAAPLINYLSVSNFHIPMNKSPINQQNGRHDHHPLSRIAIHAPTRLRHPRASAGKS